MRGGRCAPCVAADAVKPDDGAMVRIARDPVGQPKGAIRRHYRRRRGGDGGAVGLGGLITVRRRGGCPEQYAGQQEFQ